VLSIVAKFEEPGAEITSGGTAAEEATRKERSTAVVFLVGKVSQLLIRPTLYLSNLTLFLVGLDE
jgi:hypothetical protein